MCKTLLYNYIVLSVDWCLSKARGSVPLLEKKSYWKESLTFILWRDDLTNGAAIRLHPNCKWLGKRYDGVISSFATCWREKRFFTPSIPNYKLFQESWRVKVFQVWSNLYNKIIIFIIPSIIRFFISYIFILYLFDVINLYVSLYNFSQTWKSLTLQDFWNDL